MALVFMDGFDHYLTADTLKKWTGLSNGTTIATCDVSPAWARPPGGMGMKLSAGGSGQGIYRSLGSTHTSFTLGFNIYFATTVSSTAPIVCLWDSGTSISTTYQLALRLDAGGHLVVATGANAGTVLTTSTNVLSTGTWYHVEMTATINNTTGSYEVRVNGSSTGWIPAASSKNTRGESSNNYVDTVGLASAGTVYVDDFYFLSSASPNNTFVGPQKVALSSPVGAGNYAQWTGNYASNFANVNEIAGDSDATFNQSAAAGNKDTFAFSDVPAGTITAVQHVLMARQDAGAQRQVRPITRSGSTDYSGTTFNTAGSYQFLLDPEDVDPATSSAWTTLGFNAEEHGYELVS